MSEQWMQWRPPIEKLNYKYYITAIVDDVNGFYIRLGESGNTPRGLLMSFENSIDAYRSSDESYRCAKLLYLHDVYGDEFFTRWSFFKVTNSEYLAWLSKESGGISDDESVEHFALITEDSILDIATSYEPKIEIVADITKHKILV